MVIISKSSKALKCLKELIDHLNEMINNIENENEKLKKENEILKHELFKFKSSFK